MELAHTNKMLIRIRYTDDCSKFINKDYYEPLKKELMNRSSLFFPNKPIIRNAIQPKGECDFVDSSGNKYEAKLIINSKQGKMLGQEINKDITGFFQEIMSELTEFGNIMRSEGKINLEEMKLYKIVLARVIDCKPDENIILFIPFPIFPESEKYNIFDGFTDCAQKIYDDLYEKGILKGRDFYYIYPIHDGIKYMIRNPKTKRKERIPMPEYQKYLCFEMVDKI